MKVTLVRTVLVSDGGYPSTSVTRTQTAEAEVTFVEPEPFMSATLLTEGEWRIAGHIRGNAPPPEPKVCTCPLAVPVGDRNVEGLKHLGVCPLYKFDPDEIPF